MRTAPRILLLLLLTLSAGCARNRSGAAVQPREATVEIQNLSWLDMTIYVLDGGRRHRLGLAGATATREFRIPDSVVGLGRTLRFQADPVGSSNVANSFEIHVSPGQKVRLTIPPSAGR